MNPRIPAFVATLWMAVAFVNAGGSAVDFWPAWRGPLATGEAPKGNPPTEWSDSKNIRWKVEIPGRGDSSPIVWGERVYLMTAVKTDRVADAGFSGAEFAADAALGEPAVLTSLAQDSPQPPPPPGGDRPRRGGGGRGAEKPTNVHEFTVIAIERKTGKTAWSKIVRQAVPHAGTHPDGTQASASLVTDGKHLYANFGSQGVFCLDMNGQVKWDVDFGDMATRNGFGEGSSPALHGDTLIVNWDHEQDDFIAALDANTGKERWRKPRDEPTTWSTPLVVEVRGKPQVIVQGTKRVRAYDLATGDVVWECGGLTENVIPSPVCSDGVAYLISGFRGAALKAVKLSEAKGDISESKSALLYSTTEFKTPYVPSPLLAGGNLYFYDNNRAVLTCVDARTGKAHYDKQRINGMQNVYASPVAAAGHAYLCDRDGATVVIKLGDKFEIVATNKLDDGFDASPAIAGGELYLRGRSHLYCIAAP